MTFILNRRKQFFVVLLLFDDIFSRFVQKDGICIIISIMRGAFVGMMILFTRDIFLCIHSAFQRLVDRASHYVGKFLLSDQTHAYDVHRLPSIGSSRRLSRHLLLLLWIYITAFFKIHSFPLRRLICCRLLKCFVWLW